MVSSGQSNIMVRIEKILVMWIDHRKRQGLNVTFDDNKNKAMECYSYLKENETGPVPNFVASMGWFYKFKVRYSFPRVKRSGGVKSTDEDAAASYPDRLKAIIEGGGGGYKPQQVFNTAETGLQWKKMPERTYITREEKSAPDFKAFKDRFTLGMVYHAENPRALKGHE